jgi:MraZ protein
MFVGTHERTIDSKGRIFIPVKFREDLYKGVILSRGFHGRYLFMYSKEGWRDMAEKIKSKKVSEVDIDDFSTWIKASADVEDFSTWISASASEESMDQQGRTRIPLKLIKYAGLKRNIVIVGQIDKAMIWDKELWLKHHEKLDSKFSDGKTV